jgi:hypothetical protein
MDCTSARMYVISILIIDITSIEVLKDESRTLKTCPKRYGKAKRFASTSCSCLLKFETWLLQQSAQKVFHEDRASDSVGEPLQNRSRYLIDLEDFAIRQFVD